MPLDNTIALVSVEEVKAYLHIPSDITEGDVLIEALINAASKEIERRCNNRKFRKVTAAISEIFDGDGESNRFTRYAPITGSPSLYYWDGSTWQTGASWSITQDNDRGEIWFDDGNVFWKGSKNWKVVYTYGWELSQIPADLKQACIRMIAINKKLFDDDLHGVSSKSFVDNSTSINLTIPADVLATIYSYRRIMK